MKLFQVIFVLLIVIKSFVKTENNSSKIVRATENESVKLECSLGETKDLNKVYDESEDNLEDYESELDRKKRNSFAVIQWFKDSIKLNKFISPSKYEQEGSLLKISNLNVQDSGNYTCKSINGGGSSSGMIILQVEKSNKTQQIVEQTTKLIKSTRKKASNQRSPIFLNTDKEYKFSKQKGEEVKFNCKATGVPKPDIMWFKNGEILSEEDYGITRSKFSLNLKDLRLDDNGNFTCQVFNKYGSINATFELTVNEDSQIFEGLDPLNSTISTGMDAVFNCKVKSNNLPNIKWMKQISKAEYTNYVIQNSNADQILKDKDLNSEELKSLYVLNSLPSLKLREKSTKKSELDDTFLNDLITGNDISKQDEFNFELFVPSDIDYESTTKKIETKSDDSVHYITLSSSPSIVEKFSYNKEKNYYISQLTIKQATIKDSGIYVCFGASTNGYSYRKSYLKVLPTIKPIQPEVNFYPNDLYKFKQVDYKENLYFNNGPFIVSTTTQSNSINLMTIQYIGYIIIGVPVILISLFALISVCYLKKLDNLKETERRENNKKCSLLSLFKLFIKPNEGSRKKSGTALIPSYDETMEKKHCSFAKNTLSTSASSEHTSTLQCVTTSLGSSLSDSSSETTVAYYATIPLLVDNNLSSPPPLPNSQPPTFSPVYPNQQINYCKYYTNKSDNQNSVVTNLKRTESTPSMAYYKIVDNESVPYNETNLKNKQENDQQVVSDYKKLDDTINSSNRFYFQIAPNNSINNNNNVSSFSNSFNKKF